MRRKVLYVTFEPIRVSSSATMRNLEMIYGLINDGCEVDLVTIKPNPRQNYSKKLPEINGKIIELGNKSELRTKNVSMNRNENKIKLLIKNVGKKLTIHNFSISSLKYINKELINILGKDYDIIISSSDPKTSHIATKKIIELGITYDRWIQYWGDPLLIDITNDKLLPKFVLKRKEKNILKTADKIEIGRAHV